MVYSIKLHAKILDSELVCELENKVKENNYDI